MKATGALTLTAAPMIKVLNIQALQSGMDTRTKYAVLMAPVSAFAPERAMNGTVNRRTGLLRRRALWPHSLAMTDAPFPEPAFMADEELRMFADSVGRFLDRNAPPERVA